jgi:hypothetical protein
MRSDPVWPSANSKATLSRMIPFLGMNLLAPYYSCQRRMTLQSAEVSSRSKKAEGKAGSVAHPVTAIGFERNHDGAVTLKHRGIPCAV